MARFTDPAYLREEQYKTPSNLNARADLHQRFSTAPGSWQGWVMDQLALRPGERVLEVGGGPGWLWRDNAERLPKGMRIIFSDFSLGMVQAAREGLNNLTGIDFASCDVQSLPLAGGVFDVVIANYMVHHVRNLPRAVGELKRMLDAGGRLCVATFGAGHLKELNAMLHDFDPAFPSPNQLALAIPPRLENARDWLGPDFSKIEVVHRHDSLWVTEARPLVDYAFSLSSAADGFARNRGGELEVFFQDRIDADGGIHISKAGGVVLAWAD
jgi:SAM-dependent methyltransferase